MSRGCAVGPCHVQASYAPVSSSSNSLKAFMISSRESRSPILAVIICRNSSKSIVPLRTGGTGARRKEQSAPGACPMMQHTCNLLLLLQLVFGGVQQKVLLAGAPEDRPGLPQHRALLLLACLLLLLVQIYLPSLSMSAIIFLISSFFGSKPSALQDQHKNSKRSVRSTSPLLLWWSSRNRQGCCCRDNHGQTICVRLCVAQHCRPAHRMATLSSLASMVPEPSVSNRSKASRISCFCSSVRPVYRNSRGARRERLAACRAREAGHLCLCSCPCCLTATASCLLVPPGSNNALPVAHGAGC